MRQITRTALLAAGLMLGIAPAFAEGTSPAASGTTPGVPVATGPAQAGHQTPTPPARRASGATHASRTATPHNPTRPASGSTQRRATPAAPQADAGTVTRTDQRSQGAPTAPVPSRTN